MGERFAAFATANSLLGAGQSQFLAVGTRFTKPAEPLGPPPGDLGPSPESGDGVGTEEKGGDREGRAADREDHRRYRSKSRRRYRSPRERREKRRERDSREPLRRRPREATPLEEPWEPSPGALTEIPEPRGGEREAKRRFHPNTVKPEVKTATFEKPAPVPEILEPEEAPESEVKESAFEKKAPVPVPVVLEPPPPDVGRLPRTPGRALQSQEKEAKELATFATRAFELYSELWERGQDMEINRILDKVEWDTAKLRHL